MLTLLSLLLLAPVGIGVGADRIFEEQYFAWIKGKRIGVITNPTGVNSQLESLIDLLERRSDVRMVALFGPEHGLEGQAQAGESIASNRHIYSLYGDTRSPTAEMLKDVDLLVYDLQDVGVRFYTYISTLFESMKAAAGKGIPLVVLDRPNPIDGTRVEGPVLEAGYESFVGIYPLPIRYGMTAGELARFFNQEAGMGCDLRVVPLRDWKRRQWYDRTALAWVPPSPNMPTVETAVAYPGTCLVEGTNLSEGRGTTRPFELIGASWLKGREVVERLNDLGLSGVRFRFQVFTPTFSKYQGELCQGFQIHVVDRDLFEPIPAVLHILRVIHILHPERFQFKDRTFDRLAGNSWIRESLLEGKQVEEIVQRWKPGLQEFKKKRERYLIYR